MDAHTTELGVPMLWRCSAGNTHIAFANEKFLDESAVAAKQNPLELRRQLLYGHLRHLGVLNLAPKTAGWTSAKMGKGCGVAVHESIRSYVAQIAELAIDRNGKAIVARGARSRLRHRREMQTRSPSGAEFN